MVDRLLVLEPEQRLGACVCGGGALAAMAIARALAWANQVSSVVLGVGLDNAFAGRLVCSSLA